VRQVRTLYANNGSLQAQVSLRNADVVKAQSEIARAADDLARRQSLTGNGAVSKEELGHAQSQLASAKSGLAAAQAGVAAAREQLTSNQALTDGTSIEQHPSVLVAAAKVREAFLATQRVGLVSPVDGYVAKRTVQLGQRVAAGAPMMAIIPLNQVWVDANFKEVQLRNIRIGQPVKLLADLYGKKVEYKGSVAGLGVGTGAAFSLLPAQNATGNWIKVVQRVPVRIALDAKQILDNPLRVGLSMDAEVDVSNKDGKTLAGAPRTAVPGPAPAADAHDDAASEDVRRVIAANMGKGGRGLPMEKAARTDTNPNALHAAHAVQTPANSVAVAR
jgi:membrane fusion protein, multidrug efflux system